MKTFLILIYTLLSFNTFAISLTSEESIELSRRVKLYGLESKKGLIPTDKIIEYNRSIISILQKNIHNNFIPRLEDRFGKCNKENCQIQTSDYQILTTNTKTICLPFTQCGFYKCMEREHKCKPQGVGYFTDLAFPTCSAYTRNIQKQFFTQKGFDWIYTTMVCLQKGLIEECDINAGCNKETAKKTCKYITEFTLKFHPGCYLSSGVGVCKLPLQDKINIWRTVGKYLTSRERKEAFKVILSCIRGGN